MLYLARADGQGLSEYALLIAFLAIVVALIIGIFGQELRNLYELIALCLPNPIDPSCFGG